MVKHIHIHVGSRDAMEEVSVLASIKASLGHIESLAKGISKEITSDRTAGRTAEADAKLGSLKIIQRKLHEL